MISLFTSESWLMFNILELNGSQDLLLVPTSDRRVLEFIQNLLIVNDLAEQGIHLPSDCNNPIQSKEQSVALFQAIDRSRGMASPRIA